MSTGAVIELILILMVGALMLVLLAQRHDGVDQRTGPQQLVSIRHRRAYRDHAGRRIDGVLDHRHLT